MLRFFFSLLFAFPFIASAQSKLDPARPIKINYSSPAWNKNSQANEVAGILMRDSRTKRMARIELTETTDASGEFLGDYAINWGNDEIQPEIYVAPQEMLKSTEQLKKIEQLILDGTLLRKPFFLRTEKGVQKLTVYDTKEQAMEAFETFRKMFATGAGKAAMDAQAAAAKLAAAQAMAAAASKAEADRLKLAAQEKAKQDELKRKQSQLDAAEVARRQNQAAKLADEGRALYRSNDFKSAETKFAQAVELDPNNTSFYFDYGITLNRLEKHNRAIVVLDLATGKDVYPAQRDFYKGLSYMKLKENDNAFKSFAASKAVNDPKISPIAAFYMGVIDFEKENYEESKKNFEHVLDNSVDPAFDKQAETYIEQIANAMAFKKEQSKKFIISLNAGLNYDSNILAVSNSQVSSGVPTELAGYRWMYSGSLEYRPVYTVENEFSVILSAGDMYSTDKNFKAEQQFQNTDPLVIGLSAPYKHKGKAFEKYYQLGLTPGYEQITMNADGSGSRELFTTSFYVYNDHLLMMNENWFANYTVELRSDTAKTNTGGDDDASGTKIGLSTSQTFFQNAKKTEAWIAEFGGSNFTAKGKNETYTRFDIAANYMAPFKWDTTWIARLAYYTQDYSQGTLGRKDNDLAATLSLKKPFTESLFGTVSGTFTDNQSNVDSFTYNKYTIMTTFTWTTSL